MVGATLWLTLALPFAAVETDPFPDGTGIDWVPSFESARDAAARSGRLLLVKPLGDRKGATSSW